MKELYTLVGMKYRGTEAMVASLSHGAALTLRREPNNQYDVNAVAVYFGPHHVGYIKGTEAARLAPDMDRAGKVELPCTFAVTADRWPQVEVYNSDRS